MHFFFFFLQIEPGEVGIAYFNLSTPSGSTPEVQPLTTYVIAVLFENQVHLKLFKEGCKAAQQQIFG